MVEEPQWWVAAVLQEAVDYAEKFGLSAPLDHAGSFATGSDAPPLAAQPGSHFHVSKRATIEHSWLPHLRLNFPNFFHPAEEKTADCPWQKL